jgi:PAS domain S-box-containing protein
MSDVKTAEMQELDQSVEEKVLENMKDGVIWTADHGTIVYMNSSARNILGLEDTEIIGKKFAGVFIDRKENDGFVESVIHSVDNKSDTYETEADYTTASGSVMHLQVSNTYMQHGENRGILSVITDITEKTVLLEQKKESSLVVAIYFNFLCAFLLLYRFFKDYYPTMALSSVILSRTVEYGGLACGLLFYRKTMVWEFENRFKCKSFWKAVRPGVFVSLGLTVLMIVVKLLLISKFPQDKKFFDFSYFNAVEMYYPVTVLVQEFVARCIFLESMTRVYTGKYATVLAIVSSSMIFAAFHIDHSLIYMVLAGTLMGMLGIFYLKTKNIWATSLVHYVLGEMVCILSYV